MPSPTNNKQDFSLVVFCLLVFSSMAEQKKEINIFSCLGCCCCCFSSKCLFYYCGFRITIFLLGKKSKNEKFIGLIFFNKKTSFDFSVFNFNFVGGVLFIGTFFFLIKTLHHFKTSYSSFKKFQT